MTTRLVLKDELLDAQLLRAVGTAPSGGAEVGECIATVAERITCPTFVCTAEGDDISAVAPDLVDALVCPKEFVTFTDAEGAGYHCEAGNRAIYHARSFDWLDRVLGSAR